MKVSIDIPRPDAVDMTHQGYRGPFGPIIIMLNALTDINEWIMRQRPFPLLYDSGVRYEPEPTAGIGALWMARGKDKQLAEDFQNTEVLYKSKVGDCEDIATTRAAELRVKYGIAAKPAIKWKRMWVTATMDAEAQKLRHRRFEVIVNPGLVRDYGHKGGFWFVMMHILVLYPNGRIEDPCLVLGMKGEYQ